VRSDHWVSSVRSGDRSEDNGSDDGFLHVLSPWLSDDSRRGNLMKLGGCRDIAAKKRRMPFVAKIRREDPFRLRPTACSMAAWASHR
jgi:hypothetical protein